MVVLEIKLKNEATKQIIDRGFMPKVKRST